MRILYKVENTNQIQDNDNYENDRKLILQSNSAHSLSHAMLRWIDPNSSNFRPFTRHSDNFNLRLWISVLNHIDSCIEELVTCYKVLNSKNDVVFNLGIILEWSALFLEHSFNKSIYSSGKLLLDIVKLCDPFLSPSAVHVLYALVAPPPNYGHVYSYEHTSMIHNNDEIIDLYEVLIAANCVKKLTFKNLFDHQSNVNIGDPHKGEDKYCKENNLGTEAGYKQHQQRINWWTQYFETNSDGSTSDDAKALAYGTMLKVFYVLINCHESVKHITSFFLENTKFQYELLHGMQALRRIHHSTSISIIKLYNIILNCNSAILSRSEAYYTQQEENGFEIPTKLTLIPPFHLMLQPELGLIDLPNQSLIYDLFDEEMKNFKFSFQLLVNACACPFKLEVRLLYFERLMVLLMAAFTVPKFMKNLNSAGYVASIIDVLDSCHKASNAATDGHRKSSAYWLLTTIQSMLVQLLDMMTSSSKRIMQNFYHLNGPQIICSILLKQSAVPLGEIPIESSPLDNKLNVYFQQSLRMSEFEQSYTLSLVALMISVMNNTHHSTKQIRADIINSDNLLAIFTNLTDGIASISSPILTSALSLAQIIIQHDDATPNLLNYFLERGLIKRLWGCVTKEFILHDEESILAVLDLIGAVCITPNGLRLVSALNPFKTIIELIHNPIYELSESSISKKSIITYSRHMQDLLRSYPSLVDICVRAVVDESYHVIELCKQSNIIAPKLDYHGDKSLYSFTILTYLVSCLKTLLSNSKFVDIFINQNGVDILMLMSYQTFGSDYHLLLNSAFINNFDDYLLQQYHSEQIIDQEFPSGCVQLQESIFEVLKMLFESTEKSSVITSVLDSHIAGYYEKLATLVNDFYDDSVGFSKEDDKTPTIAQTIPTTNKSKKLTKKSKPATKRSIVSDKSSITKSLAKQSSDAKISSNQSINFAGIIDVLGDETENFIELRESLNDSALSKKKSIALKILRALLELEVDYSVYMMFVRYTLNKESKKTSPNFSICENVYSLINDVETVNAAAIIEVVKAQANLYKKSLKPVATTKQNYLYDFYVCQSSSNKRPVYDEEYALSSCAGNLPISDKMLTEKYIEALSFITADNIVYKTESMDRNRKIDHLLLSIANSMSNNKIVVNTGDILNQANGNYITFNRGKNHCDAFLLNIRKNSDEAKQNSLLSTKTLTPFQGAKNIFIRLVAVTSKFQKLIPQLYANHVTTSTKKFGRVLSNSTWLSNSGSYLFAARMTNSVTKSMQLNNFETLELSQKKSSPNTFVCNLYKLVQYNQLIISYLHVVSMFTGPSLNLIFHPMRLLFNNNPENAIEYYFSKNRNPKFDKFAMLYRDECNNKFPSITMEIIKFCKILCNCAFRKYDTNQFENQSSYDACVSYSLSSLQLVISTWSKIIDICNPLDESVESRENVMPNELFSLINSLNFDHVLFSSVIEKGIFDVNLFCRDEVSKECRLNYVSFMKMSLNSTASKLNKLQMYKSRAKEHFMKMKDDAVFSGFLFLIMSNQLEVFNQIVEDMWKNFIFIGKSQTPNILLNRLNERLLSITKHNASFPAPNIDWEAFYQICDTLRMKNVGYECTYMLGVWLHSLVSICYFEWLFSKVSSHIQVLSVPFIITTNVSVLQNFEGNWNLSSEEFELHHYQTSKAKMSEEYFLSCLAAELQDAMMFNYIYKDPDSYAFFSNKLVYQNSNPLLKQNFYPHESLLVSKFQARYNLFVDLLIWSHNYALECIDETFLTANYLILERLFYCILQLFCNEVHNSAVTTDDSDDSSLRKIFIFLVNHLPMSLNFFFELDRFIQKLSNRLKIDFKYQKLLLYSLQILAVFNTQFLITEELIEISLAFHNDMVAHIDTNKWDNTEMPKYVTFEKEKMTKQYLFYLTATIGYFPKDETLFTTFTRLEKIKQNKAALNNSENFIHYSRNKGMYLLSLSHRCIVIINSIMESEVTNCELEKCTWYERKIHFPDPFELPLDLCILQSALNLLFNLAKDPFVAEFILLDNNSKLNVLLNGKYLHGMTKFSVSEMLLKLPKTFLRQDLLVISILQTAIEHHTNSNGNRLSDKILTLGPQYHPMLLNRIKETIIFEVLKCKHNNVHAVLQNYSQYIDVLDGTKASIWKMMCVYDSNAVIEVLNDDDFILKLFLPTFDAYSIDETNDTQDNKNSKALQLEELYKTFIVPNDESKMKKNGIKSDSYDDNSILSLANLLMSEIQCLLRQLIFVDRNFKLYLDQKTGGKFLNETTIHSNISEPKEGILSKISRIFIITAELLHSFAAKEMNILANNLQFTSPFASSDPTTKYTLINCLINDILPYYNKYAKTSDKSDSSSFEIYSSALFLLISFLSIEGFIRKIIMKEFLEIIEKTKIYIKDLKQAKDVDELNNREDNSYLLYKFSSIIELFHSVCNRNDKNDVSVINSFQIPHKSFTIMLAAFKVQNDLIDIHKGLIDLPSFDMLYKEFNYNSNHAKNGQVRIKEDDIWFLRSSWQISTGIEEFINAIYMLSTDIKDLGISSLVETVKEISDNLPVGIDTGDIQQQRSDAYTELIFTNVYEVIILNEKQKNAQSKESTWIKVKNKDFEEVTQQNFSRFLNTIVHQANSNNAEATMDELPPLIEMDDGSDDSTVSKNDELPPLIDLDDDSDVSSTGHLSQHVKHPHSPRDNTEEALPPLVDFVESDNPIAAQSRAEVEESKDNLDDPTEVSISDHYDFTDQKQDLNESSEDEDSDDGNSFGDDDEIRETRPGRAVRNVRYEVNGDDFSRSEDSDALNDDEDSDISNSDSESQSDISDNDDDTYIDEYENSVSSPIAVSYNIYHWIGYRLQPPVLSLYRYQASKSLHNPKMDDLIKDENRNWSMTSLYHLIPDESNGDKFPDFINPSYSSCEFYNPFCQKVLNHTIALWTRSPSHRYHFFDNSENVNIPNMTRFPLIKQSIRPWSLDLHTQNCFFYKDFRSFLHLILHKKIMIYYLAIHHYNPEGLKQGTYESVLINAGGYMSTIVKKSEMSVRRGEFTRFVLSLSNWINSDSISRRLNSEFNNRLHGVALNHHYAGILPTLMDVLISHLNYIFTDIKSCEKYLNKNITFERLLIVIPTLDTLVDDIINGPLNSNSVGNDPEVRKINFCYIISRILMTVSSIYLGHHQVNIAIDSDEFTSIGIKHASLVSIHYIYLLIDTILYFYRQIDDSKTIASQSDLNNYIKSQIFSVETELFFTKQPCFIAIIFRCVKFFVNFRNLPISSIDHVIIDDSIIPIFYNFINNVLTPLLEYCDSDYSIRYDMIEKQEFIETSNNNVPTIDNEIILILLSVFNRTDLFSVIITPANQSIKSCRKVVNSLNTIFRYLCFQNRYHIHNWFSLMKCVHNLLDSNHLTKQVLNSMNSDNQIDGDMITTILNKLINLNDIMHTISYDNNKSILEIINKTLQNLISSENSSLNNNIVNNINNSNLVNVSDSTVHSIKKIFQIIEIIQTIFSESNEIPFQLIQLLSQEIIRFKSSINMNNNNENGNADHRFDNNSSMRLVELLRLTQQASYIMIQYDTFNSKGNSSLNKFDSPVLESELITKENLRKVLRETMSSFELSEIWTKLNEISSVGIMTDQIAGNAKLSSSPVDTHSFQLNQYFPIIQAYIQIICMPLELFSVSENHNNVENNNNQDESENVYSAVLFGGVTPGKRKYKQIHPILQKSNNPSLNINNENNKLFFLDNTNNDHKQLLMFVEQHHQLINNKISDNIYTLDEHSSNKSYQTHEGQGSLVSMIHCQQLSKFIDFKNKRKYFYLLVKRLKYEHHKILTDEHDNNEDDDDEEEDFDRIDLLINRTTVLETSFERFTKLSTHQLIAAYYDIAFVNEEGVDSGGLTREWLSLLIKNIFSPNNGLFVLSADLVTYQPFIHSSINPDHLKYFGFIGKIIAKAILDRFVLDVHFTRAFYKHILGIEVTFKDLQNFDPSLHRSLTAVLNSSSEEIEIMELNFTTDNNKYGEVVTHELIPGGRDMMVTIHNKEEYVRLITHYHLFESVKDQITAFLDGFHQVLPAQLLSILDPVELELLISGLPDIDIDDLKSNTSYAGYHASDQTIIDFWKILEDCSSEEKALFVQFVTGTAKVPLDGFAGLRGSDGIMKVSIHKVKSTTQLPTAHTCFNQLDLPDYNDYEVLKEKLILAIREGSEGFGFA
eukprot:gene9283-12507_t